MTALHQLAELVGILPSYYDVQGNLRETSDETRRALLTAMGYEVADDDRARASLEALQARERARLLDPVAVVEIGSECSRSLRVRAPDTASGSLRWFLEVQEESGELHRSEGTLEQGAGWHLELPMPALPLGYHTARLAVQGAVEGTAEQSVIVVPPSCTRIEEVLGEQPAFGFVANLYSVRRDGDWGVGDLRTLALLLDWAADAGGSFVGVNPLHALRNRGTDVSPYSPVSRLFRNPLYIDVASVPGYSSYTRLHPIIGDAATEATLEQLRAADRIDYARAWAVKREALERLHRRFDEAGEDAQREAYHAWCARHDPALSEFATFSALQDAHPLESDWRQWPRELQQPQSAAVRQWRDEHRYEVDLHRWLQWVLDGQLREVQAHARAHGLPVGLYQDLAIGTSPAGSDTWSFGDLFVHGVNVGAPPDPYSDTGQDWGLPPIDPRVLRERRYDYWIRLLRSAFAGAGALRIDHVMGLFRLFWIPWGHTGVDGAYVRYPADDLLGILALESRRHGALVVGEDLGTVPPEVPPALEKWGMLSTSVMMFMRGDGGSFLASSRYPRRALAVATTHDMAPVAGFWNATDVALRLDLGLSPAEEGDRLREERARERSELLSRLRREGVVSGDAEEAVEAGGVALRAAVHAYMSRTPAALVGLALDDLAGEDVPVNVPGVGPDRYPSWTRRMRFSVEEMRASGAVDEAMRVEGRARVDGAGVG